VIFSAQLAGEPEHPADGNGLALIEKLQKIDGPRKDHLKAQGGDGQVEMFQAHRR
jgi:hypothetical protein